MITSKEMDQIEKLKELIQKDSDLLGLFQFGSSLHDSAYRDIDLCIFVKNVPLSIEKKLKYRIFLSEFYDVQYFDDLPLYIKHEVLKNGKKILMKNEEIMYDIAYKFIKQFADFEPHFRNYLELVKNA